MVTVVAGNMHKVLEGVDVYIHLKGFARARVTHVDIEHEELERIVAESSFLRIRGIRGGGFEIWLERGKKIVVRHPLFSRLLNAGSTTIAWVGVKEGGIYVGFRKEYVEKLEEIGRQLFQAVEH